MMKLTNIVLPEKGPDQRFEVVFANGAIDSINPTVTPQDDTSDPPSLLLEPLCHPHLHLDKPYLLTCNQPRYADLELEDGSFEEALRNTSAAKARYTAEDLYLRGSQLLATSYAQGVTSVRAFVELDHVVDTLPLTTAIRLKQDFSHLVTVQICAFAQDPLFSAPHGPTNREILASALSAYAADIDVLGTTPYVEADLDASLRNIEWAVTTALENDLHLDFHLDYNLDAPSADIPPAADPPTTVGADSQPGKKPLIYAVLDALETHSWPKTAADNSDSNNPGPPNPASRTIVLGHCTQLTLLTQPQLTHLAHRITTSRLPIHLVGLPTSDLFTQGRPPPSSFPSSTSTTTITPHARPRATLQVVSLIRDLGLRACLGANNVGNAFAPFGSADPLALVCWGVGLYHAGARGDAELLYGCVARAAREAIGLLPPGGAGGDDGRMLLVGNRRWIEVPAGGGGGGGDVDGGGRRMMKVPARQRLSIRDVVWDPPEVELRRIVP